jgi:uncharacterized protein YjiS (DUF1127 family)
MRLLVHVLARLAITATFTSSAAALDAQAELRENPSFTSSLSESLMLNSAKAANAVVGRYRVIGRELRVEPSRHGHALEQLTPSSATAWPSIFWFFLEGFALYGASLHAIATSPVAASTGEAGAPQPQELLWRERRKSISLVTSRASGGLRALEREGDIDRIALGSNMPFATNGHGSPAIEVDRIHDSGSLTGIWSAIVSRWAKWRREREIKGAVAALAEFDDRTLRDMGISHRSRIEQVVRYGRDC